MAKFAGKGIKVVKTVAKELLGDEVIKEVVKAGSKVVEKYNNRIKIPDVKDVLYEEAVENLIGLGLLPIVAVAKPNVAYADSEENVVVNSSPKFGKKVDPNTTVKIYYATSDVIQKSKEMEADLADVFKLPRLIGLDIYEAREDLEELGLKVSLKLESPSIKFSSLEDGQVTRVTYPGNKRLTLKQKKGERIWLYYVDEAIIEESVQMIEGKKGKYKERNEKATQTFNNISNRFKKKKAPTLTNKNPEIEQE